MSRRRNPVAAVIWLVISLILMFVLVRGIVGKRRFHDRWEKNTYRWIERILNSSEIHIGTGNSLAPDYSKLYSVNESYEYQISKINRLNLELISERIEISKSSSSEEVKVTLNGNWGEYKPEVRLVGDTLHVTANKNVKYTSSMRNGSVEIEIPSKKIDRIDVDNVSGSIRVNDAYADAINIESVSGSIRTQDCHSNYASIKNVSGSIGVSGSYDGFSIENVSGSIKVFDDSELKSNSKIDSVSGSIELDLSKTSRVTVDYENTSGSVSCGSAYVKRGSKHEGTMEKGTGGCRVDVSAVSGSIRVY